MQQTAPKEIIHSNQFSSAAFLSYSSMFFLLRAYLDPCHGKVVSSLAIVNVNLSFVILLAAGVYMYFQVSFNEHELAFYSTVLILLAY